MKINFAGLEIVKAFEGCLKSIGGGASTDGGQSAFSSVAGNGGQKRYINESDTWVGGAAGTASGGDTNTTGGGAAGAVMVSPSQSGGNGGRSQKAYTTGQLTPGATITVVVGAKGVSAYGGVTVNEAVAGSVAISWT